MAKKPVALKACPFDGGPVSMDRVLVAFEGPQWWIVCVTCPARMRGKNHDEPDTLIAAWNRRVKVKG